MAKKTVKKAAKQSVKKTAAKARNTKAASPRTASRGSTPRGKVATPKPATRTKKTAASGRGKVGSAKAGRSATTRASTLSATTKKVPRRAKTSGKSGSTPSKKPAAKVPSSRTRQSRAARGVERDDQLTEPVSEVAGLPLEAVDVVDVGDDAALHASGADDVEHIESAEPAVPAATAGDAGDGTADDEVLRGPWTQAAMLTAATEAVDPSDPAASRTFAVAAARLLRDYRCEDVVVLDVRPLGQISEFIVIASGTSDRQMRSMLDYVEQLGLKMGSKLYRRDVDDRTTWIVADFTDVMVHLFEPNTRATYDLEMLWADAPRVAWERSDQATKDRAGVRQA